MFPCIRQPRILCGFISEPRALWPRPGIKGTFHVLCDVKIQLPALGSAVPWLEQAWMLENMEMPAQSEEEKLFPGEESGSRQLLRTHPEAPQEPLS